MQIWGEGFFGFRTRLKQANFGHGICINDGLAGLLRPKYARYQGLLLLDTHPRSHILFIRS
jgi:hypothetical protein